MCGGRLVVLPCPANQRTCGRTSCSALRRSSNEPPCVGGGDTDRRPTLKLAISAVKSRGARAGCKEQKHSPPSGNVLILRGDTSSQKMNRPPRTAVAPVPNTRPNAEDRGNC